jgi:N-acetylglucosaminyldiphosphoundecaprenol N-acetyl-beta-D-mannosaminyltransferase
MSLPTDHKTGIPPAHAFGPDLPSADVPGVPIVLSDYEGIMDGMDALISARQPACLSAASVHMVMVAPEDAHTREAVLRETTVPDGPCLVWALQALRHRQASRLDGHDLMALYCERAASRTRAGMSLYGVQNERALELLTDALCARFPGLDIVGGYPPPYRELTYPERDAVAAKINRYRRRRPMGRDGAAQTGEVDGRDTRAPSAYPRGRGRCVRPSRWIIPQAPSWMQRARLEWAFRLSREKRRLWRRYARHTPRFVAASAASTRRARATDRRADAECTSRSAC